MKLRILNSARARWCLGAALCALLAALAAVANLKGISLLPPGHTPQNLEIAGATTEAVVDPPHTTTLQRGVEPAVLTDLTGRTLLLGELMSTPPVLAQIADQARLAPSQLSGSTSYVQNIPEQLLWPDLEVRANHIIDARAPYQLNIEPDPGLPRLAIYARAPTPAGAERLADAAVPGLQAFLRADAISHRASPANQVRLTQLGPARGGVVNAHANVYIVGLTFLIVFALSAVLIVFVVRVRRGWKLAARARTSLETAHSMPYANRSPGDGLALRRFRGSSVTATPSGTTTDRRRGHLPRLDARQAHLPANRAGIARLGTAGVDDADTLDAWPHTTRVLPWMIAAFLLVLWLVPFDAIQVGASLPIDLKFDRVVLPIVVATWVLVLAAGGRAAPRLRLSWVHAGVFLFAGLACLSFVVNAHYLNDTLQLDQGVKRLALLLAYVTFFVVTASVVRRSEVSAFLRYTLVLAVIAAIGTIVEYRFKYNIFYDLSQKLLPGFQVGQAGSVGVDDIGRRLVRGPAEAPLEAVAMFTMALPIALVGLIDAAKWKPRFLYGCAAALLLAGSIATERKSGLLGPLAVVLTVAFFKRRALVRLAPLGVVLVAVVKVVAPGAIGSVATQLQPSQLGVNTVTDRVLRYDAIRPDVWLHLAFGQGFGTYTVRILDNELLGRLVEGGVLGLSAYVLMLLMVVFVALGPIRRREPVASTIGLVAASSAVAVLVLSATYDWVGFPHGPYIFLSLAGLLAVVVKSPAAVTSTRIAEPPRAAAPAVLEQIWSS